jgi:DNA-binding transcriptional LysR family regulator
MRVLSAIKFRAAARLGEDSAMPPSFNPARYDLLSIRIAVACAQHGSLSAAAAGSNLALAAASRRLCELEATLGTPLFERHRRGLLLTPAGHIFIRHALALLQTAERLGGELRDFGQGIARHVSLCASTAAINEFLPPLLARYAKSHPGVRVDLEEQMSDAIPDAVREGRSDLGIFVEGVDARGIETRLFREDELVVVLPRAHRLAKSRRGLSFAQLLDEDWVSLNTGAALLAKLQHAALAANRPLKLRFQVRSFDAVCHLVDAGLGVAVLPRAAAEPVARTMSLVLRPLDEEWAKRRLLLAMRSGSGDDVVQALAQFLAQPSQVAKARVPKRQ